MKKLCIALCLPLLFLSCNKETPPVVLSGWGGNPNVNAWIGGELVPFIERTEGVKAVWSPMNIDEILAKLENEKNADAKGTIDVVWINGENFRYAKEHGLLEEGFLSSLDNAKKYLDLGDEKNINDFAYPTGLSESPWGRAQFIFAADTAKAPSPPKSAKELRAFLEEHPGTFTYPESNDFTASAFLRVLIYDIVGFDAVKDLPADKALIARVIQPVFDYLNAIEPLLWRSGTTYPKTVAQLDELFQDGSVYFTMDYNSYKSYSQINDGRWPTSARTFVWDNGTPSNTHFLAIPFNSQNKEGAKKAINASLSPDMQASKARLSGWGDAPVIDFNKLTPDEKNIFAENLVGLNPVAAASLLSDEELGSHAQAELAGDVVVVIEQLWQEEVLLK
ncbi:MAG: ABC transporter substrate-binding protein [Spirochaetaceae bacterium]|jgi:putative spermidine/putrescine transport system substrate-binding protein|nr:ABC transporter substrate-binding protein [Spirochaetaceae bacterium]